MHWSIVLARHKRWFLSWMEAEMLWSLLSTSKRLWHQVFCCITYIIWYIQSSQVSQCPWSKSCRHVQPLELEKHTITRNQQKGESFNCTCMTLFMETQKKTASQAKLLINGHRAYVGLYEPLGWLSATESRYPLSTISQALQYFTVKTSSRELFRWEHHRQNNVLYAQCLDCKVDSMYVWPCCMWRWCCQRWCEHFSMVTYNFKPKICPNCHAKSKFLGSCRTCTRLS